MYITCQNCDTTFRLDERLLKPSGSKVRCSQCSHVFVAHPPQPETSPPAAEKADAFTGAAMPPVTGRSFGAPPDQAPPAFDTGEGDRLFEPQEGGDPGALETKPEPTETLAEEEGLEGIDQGDLDLDLDFDMELEPEEPPAPAAQNRSAGDVIDQAGLEMDFGLDDVDAVEVQPANLDDQLIEDNAEADLDIDLEDINLDLEDLSLEEEPGPVSFEEDATVAAVMDEDLDFSMDEIEPLGEEESAAAETAPVDDTGDADLELDFDLEEPAEADELQVEDMELSLDDTPAEQMASGDLEAGSEGIDLSDLDNLLGGEASGEASLEELDLAEEEPELELDSDLEPPTDSAAEVAEEELEDLDFELDAEFEDKPVAKAGEKEPVLPEGDDLDLSDIEKLLEGEADAGGPPPSAKTESIVPGGGQEDFAGDDFDLSEFEAALDSAGESAAASDDTILDQELEFDIPLDGDAEEKEEPSLNIENDETAVMDDLELDFEHADQTPVDAGDELDLQLDLESDEPSSDFALEEDDELDLSGLSRLVEDSGATGTKEVVDAGDMELEFEIEENLEPSFEARPATPKTSDAVTELAVDETITAAAPAPEKSSLKTRPRPVKAKNGASKSLIVVLILVLLGAGGYLGYDYVIKNNIQIPYLSDYINPQAKDPTGTLNLSTMDITSKFIENENAGRLFIITGKVRNGYTGTRGQVMLRGKLFSKGKVLVKTENTYAGVTLTDHELATLPVQEIESRLNAVPKPQDIGTLLRAGQTLPFLVVFSNLPDDLDEFVIEAVGSKAIQ
jgi:pilus assembly protein FimV